MPWPSATGNKIKVDVTHHCTNGQQSTVAFQQVKGRVDRYDPLVDRWVAVTPTTQDYRVGPGYIYAKNRRTCQHTTSNTYRTWGRGLVVTSGGPNTGPHSREVYSSTRTANCYLLPN